MFIRVKNYKTTFRALLHVKKSKKKSNQTSEISYKMQTFEIK